MAKKGLRSWVSERWVDIANKRSDGSYPIRHVDEAKGKKEKTIPNVYPLLKPDQCLLHKENICVTFPISRKQSAEKKSRKGKKPNYART